MHDAPAAMQPKFESGEGFRHCTNASKVTRCPTVSYGGERVSVLIISDRPAVATHLRRVLMAQGRDCPITNVLPLEQVKRLSGGDSIDVLFLIVPGDQEQSVSLIRQARSVTTGRIICVGIPHEPRVILEALHAGADDYVDESGDVESQVSDVLMRIESVRRKTHPVGSLVTVTSASGGAGCTLIASNLAIALARRLSGCGLIDLASEYGQVGDHFNIKPRHTLGDLLRSVDSLDPDVVSQSLSGHDSGVAVLAGGLTQDDLDEAHPSDIERILQLTRGARPCSIIDADRRSTRRFRLAQLADTVLLVVRLDFPSLCSARRLLDEWQEAQIDSARIVVVANRSGQPAEIPASKANSFLRRAVDFCLIDDPVNANVSINCGVPLFIEAPKSKLAQQIDALARRVVPPPKDAADLKAKAETSFSPIANLFRRKIAASI